MRPDVGAPLAASLTGKPRLNIRQPDVIRPSIRAQRRPMTAVKVRAINQEPANAHLAHLSEGDLLAGRFGHAAIEARTEHAGNISIGGVQWRTGEPRCRAGDEARQER
jgi:hypothetical protein